MKSIHIPFKLEEEIKASSLAARHGLMRSGDVILEQPDRKRERVGEGGASSACAGQPDRIVTRWRCRKELSRQRPDGFLPAPRASTAFCSARDFEKLAFVFCLRRWPDFFPFIAE
jgi:hypothetical protein